MTKSVEWWQAQARQLTGNQCLKCGGFTLGVYVPPSMENQLECAVVEQCRVCGWESVRVRGRGNEPQRYYMRPTSMLKQVGVPGIGDPPKFGGLSATTYYRLKREGKTIPRRKVERA